MRLLHNIIDIERLIHSIKTVIAILIGLLLGKVVGMHAAQWIIISIIVVMCTQIYVGSVVQKAYLRFLGTSIGCLFAAITIVFAGDSPLAVGIAISLSAFIFSYLVTKQEDLNPAGTLGAVTTAIIMLGPTPTLWVALQRFLEISAGILIATLVSQFVLPIHARTHLRRAQATTLAKLRDYFCAMMAAETSADQPTDFQTLDENIAKLLLKQRQLAKDSKREPLGLAFKHKNFIFTLYCEREILRAITMMETALATLRKLNAQFIPQPALTSFNEQVVTTINCLIDLIYSNSTAKKCTADLNINDIKVLLQQNRTAYSEEALVYLDGFLFSAEVMVDALKKLERLFVAY
jgi:uncharacterized membrane protein YccC